MMKHSDKQSIPSEMVNEIWIIEDHPLYREALGMLLTDRFQMKVLNFDSITSTLNHAVNDQPRLILVDFNLNAQYSGTEALLVLRNRFPMSKLVTHSAIEDSACVHAALAAGAQAFISKAVTPDTLTDNLIKILSTVTTETKESWITPYAPTSSILADMNLTDRQLEIMWMIVEGKSNKEIASTLNLAEITIKQHLSKIFEKLGVKTRTQVIAKINSQLKFN